MLVWTAYSRRKKGVIEYEVSDEGIESCKKIVERVKARVEGVERFYSDANSCYRETFKRHFPCDKLTVTKAETHLVESSNSSIRDNIVRFNRRTKGYTKGIEMLKKTLEIFFNKDLIERVGRIFFGGEWRWGQPMFH
jgi:IS1 family transposase